MFVSLIFMKYSKINHDNWKKLSGLLQLHTKAQFEYIFNKYSSFLEPSPFYDPPKSQDYCLVFPRVLLDGSADKKGVKTHCSLEYSDYPHVFLGFCTHH